MCLVLASVVAVIIYRVIARVDLFQSRGEAGQLIASVTSTFLNTVSIMIMGKVCILQINYLFNFLQFCSWVHVLHGKGEW